MVKLNFITSQEHGLHSMQEHTHKTQLLLSEVYITSQGLNFHTDLNKCYSR